MNFYGIKAQNIPFEQSKECKMSCHITLQEFTFELQTKMNPSRSFKGKENAQYQFQRQTTLITFNCLFLKCCPVQCS